MVKGRDTQTETVKFSTKILSLWTVRTGDYLEETEAACTRPYWHLPKDISEDFIQQWISAKKRVVVNKTNNQPKVVWFKEKQNDFRYADIHTYIALDIPWNNTTLRRCLDQEDWSYNPVVAVKNVHSENNPSPLVQEEDDDEDDYSDTPFSPRTSSGFSFKF